MGILRRFRQYVHPPTKQERQEIIADITESASPGFDFFLLVVLSCSIATMGLITNSPAVIIGAMLVAPLMSPIIGLGLASIMGHGRLAESALSALLRGAGLAILLSALMTIVNRNLPFVVLQELPSEVLARTHPSPIDLVIALAGGLAAAYAMTRPKISAALPGVAIATALMPPLCSIGIGLALERMDVAGGATLLFITNAVTIAFAAALVFFLQGFVPQRQFRGQLIPRTLLSSASLTLVLLIPLSFYSIKFFNEANQNRMINDVVAAELARMPGADLVELDVNHVQDRQDNAYSHNYTGSEPHSNLPADCHLHLHFDAHSDPDFDAHARECPGCSHRHSATPAVPNTGRSGDRTDPRRTSADPALRPAGKGRPGLGRSHG